MLQLHVQQKPSMNVYLMENMSRRILVGLIAGVFTTLIVLTLFAFFFRAYQSETIILILPQSTAAAIEGDMIGKNILTLTRTERFAVLLGKNGIDEADVSVTRGRTGNMIRVRYENDDRSKAIRGIQETTRALLMVTSRYYNIKTSIDMRIIDGPITRTRTTSPLLFTILSVAIGIVAYFIVTRSDIFFPFVDSARTFFHNKSHRLMPAPSLSSAETPRNIISPQPEEKKTERMREVTVAQKIAQRPITPALKTAPAPTNLPIVGMTGKMTVGEFRANQGESSGEEPTEDELKERLNKLLRGDL